MFSVFVYRQVLNMARNLVHFCNSYRIRLGVLLVSFVPEVQTEPRTTFQLSHGANGRAFLRLPSTTCRNAILCQPGHVFVSSTKWVSSAGRVPSTNWISGERVSPSAQFQSSRAIGNCMRSLFASFVGGGARLASIRSLESP